MANYQEPRIMLTEEYDEEMNLQEKAQGCTQNHILNYYPHTAKRKNFIFENHFVIKENKKIVSHVGLFPLQAVADGATVKVGGIGDVATHPDYCGKGYMGKLLNYSVIKMKEREIPLSILGGDTQRYRHYGWETAGRKIVFHLTSRSVKEIKAGKEFNLRGYEKKDLDKIIEIHEKESLRVKRSKKDYEKLLERTQIQVWIGEEKESYAYAVLDKNQVIEFGGAPLLVAKLFSYYLNHYPTANLNVHLPYKDSQILRTLYKISSGWEIIPLGMIKIIDLKRTLLSFKDQIQKKTELFGIEKGNAFTLKMIDSHQKATLIIEDEIKVEVNGNSNVISLSDIEMVRLFFGPSPENLLTSLFPLDFYIWGLDHV
ncbi:GNAT family N-acetyltransferase [bacterium]|nr:GNAT family N-acetyltransferase [bacterium]